MKRVSVFTTVAGVSLLFLGFCVYAAGIRINTTGSIPVGLYWLSDAPVSKGEYVIFCPPVNPLFDEAKKRGYFNSGFCPGQYGYIMKMSLAAKSDKVRVTDQGVFVNGVLLPYSKPRSMDKSGRPLPIYRADIVLSVNDVLLMSNVSEHSFDSRYFGPVNRSQIQGVIRPIFTW